VAHEEHPVAKPNAAWRRMARKWALIHDLLGGTQRMRDQAQVWLPKEQAETDTNYNRRLSRSVLFEGLANAIDRAVARPFTRPVTAKNAPTLLDFLEVDTDDCGQPLSKFARSIFEDALTYGKAHILIDFTAVPENVGGGIASIAQEQAVGARATFVRVSPPALIGWLTDSRESNTGGAGDPELSQIRIRETRTEQVDGSRFASHQVDYVRVIERDRFELWRKSDVQGSEQWDLADEGPLTLGHIPLVTIYAKKIGVLEADPPFDGLAWLNLAHWQSDSDQRNILRVARFAVLFASGLTKREAEQGFEIGPFNMVSTSASSKDADLKYVEHGGKAVEAGRKDLLDLESRMEVLGIEPFVDKSAGATATGKAIDEASSSTRAQDWVRSLETGLEEAYRFAAQWHQTELPADFGVDVFSDFTVSFGNSDLAFLLDATTKGRLSTLTFLQEIKRRGQLADSVDPDVEAAQIAEEFGMTDPLSSIPDAASMGLDAQGQPL